LRHLVFNARPIRKNIDVSSIHLSEAWGDMNTRQVFTYAVPGAAAVGHSTSLIVSTLRDFWDDHANCANLFTLCMVPFGDATRGYPVDRADKGKKSTFTSLAYKLFDPFVEGGGVRWLPTVKRAFEGCGLVWDDPVNWDDRLHMTRPATSAVHAWY
jgi:hypothetical protein